MKKNVFVLLSILVLIFSININLVSAQDTGLPAPVEENTQPVLPQNDGESENNEDNEPKEVITEENTQSFLNGVIVGGIVGLIVGGVGTWVFKKRAKDEA